MKGFDYRTNTEFDRPTKELREELTEIVARGGRRRVEHGETFAHDAQGHILWEAYGFIGAVEGAALVKRAIANDHIFD